MTIGNNDLTTRSASLAAAKEIKASSHYGYVTGGITLDGSKFAVNELVVEGQCLARRKTTGKFEKYVDGVAAPAMITGTAACTPADLAAINAGTSVKFTVNGTDFVIAKAALAALTAVGGTAAVIAAVKAAVSANGVTLDNIANVLLSGDKLRIILDDTVAGDKITFTGTYGVEGDKATVEGVLGMESGLTGTANGAFNPLFDYPVILDESLKFQADDLGANPDLTAGQVLVHGAVYAGMLVGLTEAFKAATPMIRYE